MTSCRPWESISSKLLEKLRALQEEKPSDHVGARIHWREGPSHILSPTSHLDAGRVKELALTCSGSFLPPLSLLKLPLPLLAFSGL